MLQKGRTKVEWARWRHILYGFNTGPYNSDLTPLAQCASFATGFRGSNCTPKTFGLVKSGQNHLKSRQNLWKVGQNLRKGLQDRCMCFDFIKMAPKIKVLAFFLRPCFLFFSGKLGEIWGSLGKKCAWSVLWFKKCTQHEKECRQLFFRGHFLWRFFRASSGKFGQKFFAPPKICLLLHLCTATWLGTFMCTLIRLNSVNLN